MLEISGQRAFRRPQELNLDIELSSLYAHCEPSGLIGLFRDESQQINAGFEAQTRFLLEKFRRLFEANGISTEEIDDFEANFLAENMGLSRFVGQSNSFFEKTKQKLEIIYVRLTSSNVITNKASFLNELREALVVCGPGTFTRIDKLSQRVTSQENLVYWLSEYRTAIVREFSERHISKKRISDGNSLHAHIYFRKEAWQQHLGLLGEDDLAALTDINFESSAMVEEADIINFDLNFRGRYTAQTIIQCLSQRALAYLNGIEKTHNAAPPLGEMNIELGHYDKLQTALQGFLEAFNLRDSFPLTKLITTNELDTRARINPYFRAQIESFVAYALLKVEVLQGNSKTVSLSESLSMHCDSTNIRQFTYLYDTDPQSEYLGFTTVSEWLALNQDKSSEPMYQTVLKHASFSDVFAYVRCHQQLPNGVTMSMLLKSATCFDEFLLLAAHLREKHPQWIDSQVFQTKLSELLVDLMPFDDPSYVVSRIKPYITKTTLNYVSQKPTKKGWSLAFALSLSQVGMQALRELVVVKKIGLGSRVLNTDVESDGPFKHYNLALALSYHGADILALDNFRLAKAMDICVLSQRYQIGEKVLSIPALLTLNTDGINALCVDNFRLARYLDKATLNTPMSNKPNSTSAAYCLASSKKGISILKADNMRLFHLISEEAFFKKVKNSLGFEISLGMKLFTNPDGYRLLLSTKKGLSLLLAKDGHMLYCFNDTEVNHVFNSGQFKGKSLAYVFASTPDGIRILGMHDARIFKLVSRATLNHEFLSDVDFHFYTVADQLAKTEAGKALLLRDNARALTLVRDIDGLRSSELRIVKLTCRIDRLLGNVPPTVNELPSPVRPRA